MSRPPARHVERLLGAAWQRASPKSSQLAGVHEISSAEAERFFRAVSRRVTAW